MNTKVGFLLLSKDLENAPARGTAFEGGVGESLSEDGVDNLLAEQQLSTLCILDNVGNGRGSGRARLGIGVFEILDDGEDLVFAQSSKLGI